MRSLASVLADLRILSRVSTLKDESAALAPGRALNPASRTGMATAADPTEASDAIMGAASVFWFFVLKRVFRPNQSEMLNKKE